MGKACKPGVLIFQTRTSTFDPKERMNARFYSSTYPINSPIPPKKQLKKHPQPINIPTSEENSPTNQYEHGEIPDQSRC